MRAARRFYWASSGRARPATPSLPKDMPAALPTSRPSSRPGQQLLPSARGSGRAAAPAVCALACAIGGRGSPELRRKAAGTAWGVSQVRVPTLQHEPGEPIPCPSPTPSRHCWRASLNIAMSRSRFPEPPFDYQCKLKLQGSFGLGNYTPWLIYKSIGRPSITRF